MHDKIINIDGKQYGTFFVCPLAWGSIDQREQIQDRLKEVVMQTLISRGLLSFEETVNPDSDRPLSIQVNLAVLERLE